MRKPEGQQQCHCCVVIVYVAWRSSDLKSPNLLLLQPPQVGEDPIVKITDFGLSRDKGLDEANYSQTVLMTGVGSVLWMAPEILRGGEKRAFACWFSHKAHPII
jgi:serine/threonine protein kinase